jgi:hypothetical protein
MKIKKIFFHLNFFVLKILPIAFILQYFVEERTLIKVADAELINYATVN